MKISTKLSFAVSAVALVLFSSYGLSLVRAEQARQRSEVERELALLGRTLQVAAENALRDLQLVDIQEILEKLETIQSDVEILFYDTESQVIAASRRARTTDPFYAQVMREAVESNRTTLRFDPPDHPERAVLGMLLLGDDGERVGRLVVVRPLDDMRRALSATEQGIALSVGLFVLITVVLSVALGSAYVGRPLGRMMRALRRVRDGDFASALPVKSQDEVGLLTEEFNIMLMKLREARKRLEEEAEAKSRLERALRQADKLVTIGQLSAGLAHEVGSPLQILNGRARALASSPHDPGETQRNAEIMVAQTDRITKIVDQLLQVTRRRTPEMDEMDLRATVHAVADLLQVEARRRKIALLFEADPATPRILADANGIQQVALNLMTNALLATPAGGRVTITLGRSTLRHADQGPPSPSARLVVEDTGCGIPSPELEHIFEPFFTTRAGEGGTGLGLAVVRTIVAEHRGVLQVDSKVGIGSRFCVELPVGNVPQTWSLADQRSGSLHVTTEVSLTPPVSR